MSTYDQVEQMLTDLSVLELRNLNGSVVSMLKAKRHIRDQMEIRKWSIGDKVKTEGCRRDIVGEIVKINRTKVVVLEDGEFGERWNVPASVLISTED